MSLFQKQLLSSISYCIYFVLIMLLYRYTATLVKTQGQLKYVSI